MIDNFVIKPIGKFGRFDTCCVFDYLTRKYSVQKVMGLKMCIATFLFIFLLLQSCYNSSVSMAVHNVEIGKTDVSSKPIDNWYVCGTFSPKDDSLFSGYFYDDTQTLSELQNPDSLNPYWYNGEYTPIYNLLDLSEIFHLNTNEKRNDIVGKSTYLACDIYSDKEADMYLEVKKRMKCYQRLNGTLLHRIEIQGHDFYPVHFNKGLNRYVVKAVARNNDYSFETTVYDSSSVAKLFVNGQSNNIVLPEINADSMFVYLTNDHCHVLNTPVKLTISDVEGNLVFETLLKKNQSRYKVKGLREGHSYMCKMTIAGQSVRQPVVCGTFDEMYEKLKDLQNLLLKGSKEYIETEEIMYRLDFLLKHETRKTDWWWQFKIAPLTYQIEHICNSNSRNRIRTAFNVQFKSYVSSLDGGIQRYLLVTPDDVRKGKKYPLVVVIRPEVVNHHPFFVSPQFAHQWAINIIQELANTHGFIVMMPEARMYHTEDVTPFANSELKLAMADVESQYDIDRDRIYLHGICTGGYRALKMATENPGMFAAVGTYTPAYHQRLQSEWTRKHSLENNLAKLAGVPVMIFADPNDKHTPYKVYGDLIDDCRSNGVPVEFTQKINTELLYNAVVTGKEAFDFFDGKKKKRTTAVHDVSSDSCMAVVDMYSSPFVYVYESGNHSSDYRNMVNLISHDYKDYLFNSLPLVADVDVTDEMLAGKNLFLIGDHFCNDRLNALVEVAKTENGSVEDGVKSVMSIHVNPEHKDRRFVVYSFSADSRKYFKFPWIEGVERIVTSNE